MSPLTKRLKLPETTKLCSLTTIDALFASGRSALAYPLRIIYTPTDKPESQFLISVPKKRLRHAVDRVQMRRRIREAYRLNRNLLGNAKFNIAFVYVANSLTDYHRVEAAMKRLLTQIADEQAVATAQ